MTVGIPILYTGNGQTGLQNMMQSQFFFHWLFHWLPRTHAEAFEKYHDLTIDIEIRHHLQQIIQSPIGLQDKQSMICDYLWPNPCQVKIHNELIFHHIQNMVGFVDNLQDSLEHDRLCIEKSESAMQCPAVARMYEFMKKRYDDNIGFENKEGLKILW